MTYIYTPQYPIINDAYAVGEQLAQRQSGTGSPNGGIDGIPQVPTLGNDANNLSISYLNAMADVILSSCGFQETAVFTPTTNTTSTTYSDITGTSLSFTSTITKTYEVHCDFQLFRSAGTGNITVRIVAGSTNGDDWVLVPASTNANMGPFHIFITNVFTANNPATIKLQWLVTSGTTANMSGTNPVRFLIRG